MVCSKITNDFMKHASAIYFVLYYVVISALITPREMANLNVQ